MGNPSQAIQKLAKFMTYVLGRRPDEFGIQRVLGAGRVAAHAVDAHRVLLELVQRRARLRVFLVGRRGIVLADDLRVLRVWDS